VVSLAQAQQGYASNGACENFVSGHRLVPTGVKVKVTVKNEQPTTAEFESKVLHFEKIVTAGGQITLFVGPLNPGSYEFFDDFHHDTRGHFVAK
jgi:hypothetical protein